MLQRLACLFRLYYVRPLISSHLLLPSVTSTFLTPSLHAFSLHLLLLHLLLLRLHLHPSILSLSEVSGRHVRHACRTRCQLCCARSAAFTFSRAASITDTLAMPPYTQFEMREAACAMRFRKRRCSPLPAMSYHDVAAQRVLQRDVTRVRCACADVAMFTCAPLLCENVLCA